MRRLALTAVLFLLGCGAGSAHPPAPAPADAAPGGTGGTPGGTGGTPNGTGGAPAGTGGASGTGGQAPADAAPPPPPPPDAMPSTGMCGDPPAPGPLSDPALDAFIQDHVKLNGGPPNPALRPVFRTWAAAMGGDNFLANLLRRWPQYQLTIGPSNTSFAVSGGGETEYDIDAWAAVDRRLPTLVHETMHNIDNGFNPTVMALYASAKASPSKRWDSYPFGLGVPAEYMASGTEWVLLDQRFDAKENKRARLRRMDPAFYCYLVTEFIPKVLFAPNVRYSGR